MRFEAIYRFGGRPVTNQITSNILVVDGKVKEQVDTFDVPIWAGKHSPLRSTWHQNVLITSPVRLGQALGMFGKLFGGFAFLRNTVQKRANTNLDLFMAKHPDL